MSNFCTRFPIEKVSVSSSLVSAVQRLNLVKRLNLDVFLWNMAGGTRGYAALKLREQSYKTVTSHIMYCTDLRSTCIYSTYNTRGMSNMQLKGGPHGAWAGACRTSSGPDLVPRGRGGTTRFTWDILSAG